MVGLGKTKVCGQTCIVLKVVPLLKCVYIKNNDETSTEWKRIY